MVEVRVELEGEREGWMQETVVRDDFGVQDIPLMVMRKCFRKMCLK